jgi:hypothetical protein
MGLHCSLLAILKLCWELLVPGGLLLCKFDPRQSLHTL